MRFRHSQSGFTLIEVVVVIALLAIVVAAIGLSIDQAGRRQQASSLERLLIWLQAASNEAVLQSALTGVDLQEDNLKLLAGYQGLWYEQLDYPVFEVEPQFELAWSDAIESDREARSRDVDEDRAIAAIALLPTGEILPEGFLSVTSTISGDEIARVSWEEGEGFQLLRATDSGF